MLISEIKLKLNVPPEKKQKRCLKFSKKDLLPNWFISASLLLQADSSKTVTRPECYRTLQKIISSSRHQNL